MELHSPNLRRPANLIVSSRMFSLKVNTNRSLFWIDQPHSRSAPFMHDIVVTKERVTFLCEELLKGLNPFKALGPDELHPGVLKELAME